MKESDERKGWGWERRNVSSQPLDWEGHELRIPYSTVGPSHRISTNGNQRALGSKAMLEAAVFCALSPLTYIARSHRINWYCLVDL